MKSNPIRFIRDTRGQSLVEFALILPMMLVVMFMITEFGRALYTYNVLTTAARAGARAAVVASSDTYKTRGGDRVIEILKAARLDDSRTTVTWDEQDFSGTKVVICTVKRPFNWAISGPVHVNPAGTPDVVSPNTGLVLKGEATMKTETF